MQSLVNVDERLEKDGNDWQHEKMALNRNVFNNKRRNAAGGQVTYQNQQKSRLDSQPLKRIQEEQKENLNDDGLESPS